MTTKKQPAYIGEEPPFTEETVEEAAEPATIIVPPTLMPPIVDVSEYNNKLYTFEFAGGTLTRTRRSDGARETAYEVALDEIASRIARMAP